MVGKWYTNLDKLLRPMVIVVTLSLAYFLNGLCFLDCMASSSAKPSCNRRCLGGITISGTSVGYFWDIMVYQGVKLPVFGMQTANDLYEEFPLNNAHHYCNKRATHPDEGVDMHEHPLGWIRQEDGTYTGCEVQTDYPVMQNDVLSYNSNRDVRAHLQNFSRREVDGEIHRGHEFAFAQASGASHEDVYPHVALLDAPPQIRVVFMPLLRSLMAEKRLAKDTENRMREIVRKYIEGRETFDTHVDFYNLVFLLTHDTLFPGAVFPWDVQETRTKYMDYFKTAAARTPFAPKWTHKFIARKTNAAVRPHIKYFKTMLEKEGHFEKHDVASMNCNFEGVAQDCRDVMAHGVMDFFALAGGAALPKLLRLVTFMIYDPQEKRHRYADTFLSQEESLKFAMKQPALYFLESTRFFTMVMQFPYWEGPRGGSQEKKRVFLNLAAASKDPNVWGPTAHLFRKRSHEDYKKFGVAFADFAKDESVHNGANDHACPGQNMVYLIGRILLEELKLDQWEAGDDWNAVYWNSLPFVSFDDNVVIKRKTPVRAEAPPTAEQPKEKATSGESEL